METNKEQKSVILLDTGAYSSRQLHSSVLQFTKLALHSNINAHIEQCHGCMYLHTHAMGYSQPRPSMLH